VEAFVSDAFFLSVLFIVISGYDFISQQNIFTSGLDIGINLGRGT
jgi:hypothetical protein